MSKLCIGAALCAGLIASALSTPARANVIYNLTFENSGSTVEGSGVLTLTWTTLTQADSYNYPTNSQNDTLAPVFVSITTTSIGGDGPFTITPSNLVGGTNGNALETGTSGQIYTLTAQETEPPADQTGSDILFLDLYTGTWQIHGQYDSYVTGGNLLISTPSVSSTPLPAALPLFAGGLGLIGYLTRRRNRSSKQALAAA